MRRNSMLAASVLAVSVLLPSCVKRVDNSEQTRSDYEKTLDDSIASLQVQIDSCNNQIAILREKVGQRLQDFTTVANPKEVGSYTIFTPFVSKYPLRSAGLVARIDENERFELVAASPSHFDCIEVQGPSVSAKTDVVPNDQALNYRTAALTTVLFSGAAADSVGQLIADNELNPLTVIYMQGKPVASYKLTEGESKMISRTWELYSASSQLHLLERKVPLLHEKIKLLREHHR